MSLPYPSMTFVPLDVLTAEEMNQLVANIEYLSALAMYSSTEQVIGTWIDDKPLYRKVITAEFSSPIQSGTTSIPHNISGISEIIGIDAMYQLGWDQSTYGDESYLAMNGYQVIAGSQSISIINVGQNSWSGRFKFILRYTKTSD